MAMGARRETFMGLSGLGDLVLTATSARSRNLSFGVALGQGRSVASLADEPLAEGVFTARIAAALAAEHGIEAPIIAAVAGIIDGAVTVEEAIDGLVSRPLKAENA
jgi:glycerol-3-phosphate dehydrogenase (NAD(P)+)